MARYQICRFVGGIGSPRREANKAGVSRTGPRGLHTEEPAWPQFNTLGGKGALWATPGCIWKEREMTAESGSSPSRDEIREEMKRTDPEFRILAETLRERFGGRLTYFATDKIRLGRPLPQLPSFVRRASSSSSSNTLSNAHGTATREASQGRSSSSAKSSVTAEVHAASLAPKSLESQP
jgi:hypothetical protein